MPVPINKATKMPSVKIARQRTVEEVLLREGVKTRTPLENVFTFASTNSTLPVSVCRRRKQRLEEQNSQFSPPVPLINQAYFGCTQRESTTAASKYDVRHVLLFPAHSELTPVDKTCLAGKPPAGKMALFSENCCSNLWKANGAI